MIGAVEAGGTKFVLALADADGRIREQARIPTETPDKTWRALREFFATASGKHGGIAAFGIASFGPIDIRPDSDAYGTFTTTPKPGWRGARWQGALSSFGVPLAIDTDVAGAALGEWAQGAGQGCETLAYTTVGTGIGVGLIHEGNSLAGFTHYEGGHIVPPHDLKRDPYAGSCKAHGDCYEGLASGSAIRGRWGSELDEVPDRSAAIALVANYLGHLATTLVLLHAPDRLIFGGGVMKSPGLIEALREAAERHLAGYVVGKPIDPGLERYIVTPGLGDDAGITGAILLGQRAMKTGALKQNP